MSGEKLQDIHHNEVYGTVVDNGLHGLDSSLEKGGEDGELILEVGISPEDDKRLCRKIDLCLMPFLCLISGFQYLDKICMGYAAVMGFMTDNKLTLAQYSWLGSIFWFGYMAGEYPMSYLLQRFPLSKMTAINIIIWSAFLACMAVANGYQGLLAVRFFLGFFESTMGVSMILYTSQWYKPREQGTRAGVWNSMTAFANIIGGSVAYALSEGQAQGKYAIHGWKIVFITFGVCTAFIGLLFLFFVPDSPQNAWFLSPEDRVLATKRVGNNHQMISRAGWKWYQVREALTDKFVWMYLIISISTAIPNGGITAFFSIIIKGMGFTTSQTLLLGMLNATLTFWILLFPWLGDKIRRRCLISLVPSTVSICGAFMLWFIPEHNKIARLVGYYLVLPFVVAYTVGVSLLATNVVGRTKKTVVNGTFFMFCSLIGPQTFRANDAPRYVPALGTFVGINVLAMSCMIAVHIMYKRENKRRDELLAQTGEPLVVDPDSDLTDRENTNFRYTC